jgi:hypothetical protein
VRAAGESVLEVAQESVGAVQLEGHLGDEHEVGLVHGEHGVHGDEARLAPHQLDEADAVHRGVGLDVGGGHGFGGAGDGGLEAEGLVDVQKVVVDGLRNADDGYLEVPAQNLLGDVEGALLRAVAADREEHIEIEPLDRVDYVAHAVASSPRRAQEGAAHLVYFVHGFGVEGPHADVVLGQEALVSVADARDAAHPVAEPQVAHDRPDDIVDAGAETAAGDDARVDVAGVEVDALPGPCLLQKFALIYILLRPGRGGDIVPHEIIVVNIVGQRIPQTLGKHDGRGNAAVAEHRHAEVQIV